MIYTGLLSLLLAEYAANQKCSAVLLCSADSIYPLPSALLVMSRIGRAVQQARARSSNCAAARRSAAYCGQCHLDHS